MGSTFKSEVRLFTATLRETVWRCCAFYPFAFLKNFFSALSFTSPSAFSGFSLTLVDLMRRHKSPLLWTCLKPYTSDHILCYVKPFFSIRDFLKSVFFFTYNDWGEQKWTQSRKREGPGETAPAPCVRPEWTFKDWTGLCWDTGVSLGESLNFN